MNKSLKRCVITIVAGGTLAMCTMAGLGGTVHHTGEAAAMRLVATKVDN